MRNLVLGVCLAIAVAAPAARAADPKSAAGAELTGWAEPGPADLVVLEGLEGDNLAEARNARGTKLEIQAAKKDLDGDGIAEIFFFVKHPMFCYEELGGCSLLVVRRVSLSDPWQEIGVLTVPAPSLVVMPAKSGELPTLRPLGSQPYAFDGRQYRAQPADGPAVSAPDAAKP